MRLERNSSLLSSIIAQLIKCIVEVFAFLWDIRYWPKLGDRMMLEDEMTRSEWSQWDYLWRKRIVIWPLLSKNLGQNFQTFLSDLSTLEPKFHWLSMAVRIESHLCSSKTFTLILEVLSTLQDRGLCFYTAMLMLSSTLTNDQPGLCWHRFLF